MKKAKNRIRNLNELNIASKEDMIDWIKRSPKLGKKLHGKGYCDWDIWRAFQTMNKDFLSTVIESAI